jgi:hypothetical protein
LHVWKKLGGAVLHGHQSNSVIAAHEFKPYLISGDFADFILLRVPKMWANLSITAATPVAAMVNDPVTVAAFDAKTNKVLTSNGTVTGTEPKLPWAWYYTTASQQAGFSGAALVNARGILGMAMATDRTKPGNFALSLHPVQRLIERLQNVHEALPELRIAAQAATESTSGLTNRSVCSERERCASMEDEELFEYYGDGDVSENGISVSHSNGSYSAGKAWKTIPDEREWQNQEAAEGKRGDKARGAGAASAAFFASEEYNVDRADPKRELREYMERKLERQSASPKESDFHPAPGGAAQASTGAIKSSGASGEQPPAPLPSCTNSQDTNSPKEVHVPEGLWKMSVEAGVPISSETFIWCPISLKKLALAVARRSQNGDGLSSALSKNEQACSSKRGNSLGNTSSQKELPSKAQQRQQASSGKPQAVTAMEMFEVCSQITHEQWKDLASRVKAGQANTAKRIAGGSVA